METEVAKYLKMIVESQLQCISPHFSMLSNDFQKLCLQNDIVDSTRSHIVHAYRMSSWICSWIVTLVLAQNDRELAIHHIESLLSSFLSYDSAFLLN